MAYSVEHLYVNTTEFTKIVTHDGVKRAQYSATGELLIRHPGFLNVFVQALYFTQLKVGDPPDGHTHVDHPKPVPHKVPMSKRIFYPDGSLFTADHVTLADLERFRDLREASQGSWRYEVSGISDPILISDEDGWVTRGEASVRIAIDETVTSQSPGWLVSASGGTGTKHIASFDLFRVGQFIAQVRLPNGQISDTAKLQLWDPDGTTVASSYYGQLSFPVSVRTLDKSRDASGKIRPWSLEWETVDPNLGEGVSATVIATTRMPIYMLQQRIDDLLGPNGNHISVYGENKDGYALARLKILDEFSAETIDMHDLLKDVLKTNPQDPGVDISDIKKDVVYNVAHKKEHLAWGLTLDVGAIRVTIIKVTVGPSQHLQPAIPAITIDIAVDGEVSVDFEDFSLASLSLKYGWLTIEVGIELDSTGSIALRSWITDDPIKTDIRWEWIVTGLTPAIFSAYVQSEVNDKIINGFRTIVENAILSAPKILAMILGGDFTLKSLRIENQNIVFDYLAPVEPDPKPTPSFKGIIGRAVTQVGPDIWEVFPPTLGNTWAADNLAKIDHIVVVMMENRSFHHVLGYLEQIIVAYGDDGPIDLVNFLYDQGFRITALKNSGITPNAAGLKTKFPAQVGHKLKNVATQLAVQLQTPSGLTVNSPQGFLDDFADKVTDGLVVDDILGTYDGDDLAFYRFLAENYAYCGRYFSSHPGPTMPNRMYSLAGDVQYDRVGEAILDNNNGDNFSLSRATTIFDVLTRKNVSWRMYESFPSITMLRMFARYVGDNTNIFPFANLAPDVAAGNLPSVTFIDPAMHHFPENDDHPIADMLDGQIFLKFVYDTLRSNEALWLRTLLIISYDEHGGFYDHVVPPIAEVRSLPTLPTLSGSLAVVSSFKGPMMIPYGVRVPAFVVSPWVPAGRGPDITLDHCSILKTILARFCGRQKPFLSDRVNASLTFDPYLTQVEPRLREIPASPTLPSPRRRRPQGHTIVTRPVSRKALRNDADFHELTGMLARMLGRPSSSYSHPSSP
jgi:phospholipase C